MTFERMHTDSNTKPGDAKADTRSFWELLTKLYREKVNAIFTGQTGLRERHSGHADVRWRRSPRGRLQRIV